MTAAAHRPTPTAPYAGPRWAVSSARGPRRHQADAATGYVGPAHRGTGRVAVAVADGVGDSPAAALAATLVADHAVRVAVGAGRADTGLLAAHDLLLSAGARAGGDAAAVVALAPPPGGRTWHVAWVGDCRAYAVGASGATGLHPLTRDHTVAEEMRARGVTVARSFEHVLSRSVRTAVPGDVSAVTVTDPATLLLFSDGVHRALGPGRLADLLAGPGPVDRRAASVVDAARAAGSGDNATALVVDTSADEIVVPLPRGA